MPGANRLFHILTTAFLSGDWDFECLKERGAQALKIPKRRKWLGLLVKSVLAHCPRVPAPRHLNALLQYLWSELDLGQYREEVEDASLLNLPRPEMRPASAITGRVNVPQLATPGKLAEWLKITAGELSWFTDLSRPRDRVLSEPLRHYRIRLVPKTAGRWRLLEVPKPRLKSLQRQILHAILDAIPPHPAAHAFRPGHSVATYVAPHAGQDIVLHIDLCDFFPTIVASRVHAVFRTLGFPDAVARNLTSLCTTCCPASVFELESGLDLDLASQRLYRQRHLPQGAPTSPALANLCAWRMDVRLTALARRFDVVYTRYADDLLFSGGSELQRSLSRFRVLVLTIALDEGFRIRSRKTRVLLRSQSQRVAGVVLNEHPNLPRSDFDQLKALLFNCVRHGPVSQNRENQSNFAQHLLGRIAYISMINAQRGAKLKALYDQIAWPARS